MTYERILSNSAYVDIEIIISLNLSILIMNNKFWIIAKKIHFINKIQKYSNLIAAEYKKLLPPS